MRRGKGEPSVEEAYARGGRVASRKLGVAPAPKLSGASFPTMKTGPAPRMHAAPRLPAAPPEETKAPSPARVFPTRSGASRSRLGPDAGDDAVAVDDGGSYGLAAEERDG